MEGETDRDPVVSRFNVYLSKRLSKNLILLQYPVRSGLASYDDGDIISTRAKPQQHAVEIELAADFKHQSSNLGLSGMDKIKLTSSSSSEVDRGRYAVAILVNNELHVTPLLNIVQMTPTCSYLDSVGEPGGGPGVANPQQQQAGGMDSEDEARPVTVRFAPHESEEAVARRLASYDTLRRQEEEEPWVNVRHHGATTPVADTVRARLLAESHQLTNELEMNSRQYLTRFFAPDENDLTGNENGTSGDVPDNVVSLAAMMQMSLEDRIRTLMKNVRAIQFSQLLTLLRQLGETHSADFNMDVLRHLQHYAVVVQGCWVVKSEVLYSKDSEVLRSARDFILYRFHGGGPHDDRNTAAVVTRRDVADMVGPLSVEDEREIFTKIARRSSVRRGWEFMFDRDSEFLSSDHYHKHVMKMQDAYWQKQEAHWQEKQTARKQSLTPTGSPLKPKRSRHRSHSIGMTSADRSFSHSESEADTSHNSTASGIAAAANIAAINVPTIVSTTGTPPVPAVAADSEAGSGDCLIVSSSVRNRPASSSRKFPQNEVEEMDVASLLPLIIKSEPAAKAQPEDLRSPLSQFIAERLHQRTVVSIQSLRTELDLHRASLPAGHPLGLTMASFVSAELFDQILTEDCGAARLQPDGETVYAVTKRGDNQDDVRAAILKVFSSTIMSKITILRRILAEANIQRSDKDLREILREYCITYGGMWVLRETSRAVSVNTNATTTTDS